MPKILKNLNFKLAIIISCILIIISIIILPLANAFFWYKTTNDITFTIYQGESTRQIANELAEKKAIKSSFLFSAYVYASKSLLQTGVYTIKKDFNLIKIIDLLRSGKVDDYVITIPEGWRALQIEELLVEKKITHPGEFIGIAASHEGCLFPDTYKFPVQASAQSIMNMMLDNFNQKTKNMKISPDIIKLASIIERESKLDSDRAKIAGVYANRLKIGMKLDADPTIQYGKGSWAPITRNDYQNFQSLYNTYIHAGLPPTPICNPGIKSIQAAINPEKHDYYYFFTKDSGEAVFSKTFEEHLKKLGQ